MSSDQSGAAQENAGKKKKMHDKKNGANRAKAGQDLRVLKFISETGIEFQPQCILLMLRVSHTDGA
jgi:hypothetical protein